MKRVLLLIIDALTAPLLLAEIGAGRYPNLQQVTAAGVVREQCTSVFPSITHAALTSIATGQYPAQHGVLASHWYDAQKDKVIYFSSSLGVLLKKGPGDFLREFMLDLNQEHLTHPTLFQQLEADGYETASINFPIFRGDTDHQVQIPTPLKWLPGMPDSATVLGPKKLLLGDLLSNPSDLDVEAHYTGVTHWFGFRDQNGIDLVLQLAATDEFPDFTLAYFPENDNRCHLDGPAAAHRELSEIDAMLGRLFDVYGGISSFLEQFALLITGDHSQSETVADVASEAIDLSQVLADWQLAPAGLPWRPGDEILPCPNSRAAQLYLKKPEPALAEAVITALLTEPRIDQVIYRANLTGSEPGYVVQKEAQALRFWADRGPGRDRYGNQWSWQGDLAAVDGRLENGLLTFPDYPNAFERIAGQLDARHSGHIWLTARLGHEFVVPDVKAYPDGGSHAALHRLDSQPPLLVAGAPAGVAIPEYPRLIDIAPLCRQCLLKSHDAE